MSERLEMEIDPHAAFESHYRTMAEFSRKKQGGEEGISWPWFLERYFERLGHPDPPRAGPAIDNGYLLWRWVIPGVTEAVGSLREMGIRVGVVSNSDGSVTRSLTEAGLGGMFELIVDSFEVGHAKPHPEIFAIACRWMGIRPGRTWFVGDSMYHDVDGALGAGLARAILVDPLELHPKSDRIAAVADLPHLVG